MNPKQELRRFIKQKIANHSAKQRAEWSASIFEQLTRLPVFHTAQTIFVYYSMPEEVQTVSFIREWADRKRFILPVVKGDELELRLYTGEENLHQVPPYGIWEPDGPLLDDWKEVDLSIVPGVAFDLSLQRMGHGKGYYDRTLAQMNSYHIGVCFESQLVEHVPTEKHDLAMDAVITEKQVLYQKN